MVLEKHICDTAARPMTQLSKLQPEEIQEREVSISELKRHPAPIWEYLEVRGHVAIITVRGNRDMVIMSLETYAGFSDHPDDTLKQIYEELERHKKERKLDATP